VDPFADPVVPRDLDARLPDLDWTAEVPVTEGKFAGYTLLASAFTGEEVEAVADLLLGSGMAGFPLERRTLLVYLRGAVPAFPHGTYLVGRLRAPRAGTIEGRSEDAASTLDAASLASPRSSWSEEKSSAHGPVVATVGVSFTEATRRKFSSLAPPSDAAYLSDLTVFETERGNGLGIAMLAAAERFAVDMRAPSMYLHVATKKPGVVKLYKSQGYAIRAVDPGIFGWRGRLLMRKPMA
jgi:ribosomal protein S18 acetylase RimI-like enzyme